MKCRGANSGSEIDMSGGLEVLEGILWYEDGRERGSCSAVRSSGGAAWGVEERRCEH